LKEGCSLEAIVTEIAPTMLSKLAANGLNVAINSKFANFALSCSDDDHDIRLLVINLVALQGIALGAKQSQVKESNYGGEYQLLSTSEDNLFDAVISATDASIRTKKMKIKYNQPWAGFISNGAEFVGLIPGSVYFGINGDEIFAGISK